MSQAICFVNIYKALEKKICQLKIYIQKKYIFPKKNKIKNFSVIQKAENFITRRLTLPEMLKVILWAEIK